MSTETLMTAFQDAEDWLDRFNVKNYVGAYREYCARFGNLYAEAAAAENAAETISALLDAMEAEWQRQRFWNRSKVRLDIKDILVRYFSPMLLDRPEPCCEAFAAALRDGWNARWPKDAYQYTTYKKLRKSFTNSFLGLSMGKREAVGEEAGEEE